MDRKQTSQTAETDTKQHLASFEQLPGNTKELLNLKQQSEKATGAEHAATTEKISDKANK